ncbi:hypothetical protein [Streptomyces erythrochromogenes]|uniref:hypothetical protein n=1 Tax=Streptomyces erythrochromogenes TaxID=285574 RepID=UPI003865E2B0|nr:hypothetical protein OG364_03235 [Streptomyces erythrochromogenes]
MSQGEAVREGGYRGERGEDQPLVDDGVREVPAGVAAVGVPRPPVGQDALGGERQGHRDEEQREQPGLGKVVGHQRDGGGVDADEQERDVAVADEDAGDASHVGQHHGLPGLRA